jgi:uncharacterized protein (TIGR01244 family)
MAAHWTLLCVFALVGPSRATAEDVSPYVHPLTKRKPASPMPASMYKLLERQDREKQEMPDAVIEKLNLKNGSVVADIGAGSGFFSLRIAPRVGPSGKVLAVDIQQEMLDLIKSKIQERNIGNVELILGSETDPNLPPGQADWVLMVDAYHEFSHPEQMLAHIKAALKPGTGRVALLEYRAEPALDNIKFIPADHKMTFEQVMMEWQAAGFELELLYGFLPLQHFFIFKARDSALAASIEPLKLGSTPALTTLRNEIYFAGQPPAEDFKAFAEKGVKTVINLRPSQEMEKLNFDEKAVAEQAGMRYINVPFGGGDLPSEEEIGKVWSALENAGAEPVLLHCASSNRVGMFWSMFRGTRQGVPADTAIEEGKRAGLRAPQLEEMARGYIGAKSK